MINYNIDFIPVAFTNTFVPTFSYLESLKKANLSCKDIKLVRLRKLDLGPVNHVKLLRSLRGGPNLT